MANEWNTPQYIVDAARSILGTITLDPCSNEHSVVKATTEFILPTDGLVQDWSGYKTIYMNPPYGPDSIRKTKINHWLNKLANIKPNQAGIALVPSKTETTYWHDIIYKHAMVICYFKGRLKAAKDGVMGKNGPEYPHALVGFSAVDISKFINVMGKLGHIELL